MENIIADNLHHYFGCGSSNKNALLIEAAIIYSSRHFKPMHDKRTKISFLNDLLLSLHIRKTAYFGNDIDIKINYVWEVKINS